MNEPTKKDLERLAKMASDYEARCLKAFTTNDKAELAKLAEEEKEHKERELKQIRDIFGLGETE